MDANRLARALNAHPKTLGVLPDYWGLRPRFHLHVEDSVSSTNTVLWNCLEQGASAGTVVVAASQGAGRGQWGRKWHSPEGGLYLSLSLEPDLPLSASSQLTLASAWGVATSLRNLTLPVQVKWPNDLVMDNRKLGGILTETRIERGRIRAVVIGIGLNWCNPAPPGGISIHQVLPGAIASPLNTLEGFAAVVLYGLIQGYFYWQSQGADALLSAYCALLANLGQSVTVDGYDGAIAGVTAQGKIQIQTHSSGGGEPSKVLEFEPGEISLGYNA